eukprot:Gb_01771 [translate_table: standard]
MFKFVFGGGHSNLSLIDSFQPSLPNACIFQFLGRRGGDLGLEESNFSQFLEHGVGGDHLPWHERSGHHRSSSRLVMSDRMTSFIMATGWSSPHCPFFLLVLGL